MLSKVARNNSQHQPVSHHASRKYSPVQQDKAQLIQALLQSYVAAVANITRLLHRRGDTVATFDVAMTSADLRFDDGDLTRESGPESSLLNVIYRYHGYCGPYPDLAGRSIGEVVSTGAGSTQVVRISDSLAIKYGPHVKVAEAESLLFLEQKCPGVPAPRLHACYTIGPFDRDPDDFGSAYDTYIIMTFIDKKTLHEAWPDLSHDCKISIAAQLRVCMDELKSVTREDEFEIGTVNSGPLQDPVFKYHSAQGPFANETEFNTALVAIYENAMSKPNKDLSWQVL